MPPERPWIDSCTAASCRPQLVGDRRPACRPSNIETRASIPFQSQRWHQTPLKLFDLYYAHSWQQRVWARRQDWCRPSLVYAGHIAWPPPGNLGYGWSGHTSVDRHLDSPHAAASLVYPPGILLPSSDWRNLARCNHATALGGNQSVWLHCTQRVTSCRPSST